MKLFNKIGLLAVGAIMSIGAAVGGLVNSHETTAVSAATTYTKVKAVGDVSAGDKVIVAMDTSGLPSTGVTGWNGSKDATVSTTESDWVKYDVETATGGWYLKDSGASKYIASPGSSNQFKYGTKAVCSVDANGVLKCNNRYLCYNSQNGTYYRMYTSVGSYKPFYVWKVTESSGPAIEATGVELDKTTLEVEQFSTGKLTATLIPEGASSKLTWTSANENIATVENGVVTGVSLGSTTITVETEEGFSADCTVTVKEIETITIAEALATADNTSVKVRGIVKKIDSAWDSSFKNQCVTIIDENLDELYLYRIGGTELEIGDDIVAIGKLSTYQSKKQLAQGGTAYVLSKGNEVPGGAVLPVVMTIAEALAAPDGTLVIVTGDVKTIGTAWTGSYISLTITDGTDDLYCYKLSTNVALGDNITVTGALTTYNSNRQINTGATAVINKTGLEIATEYAQTLLNDTSDVCSANANLNAGAAPTDLVTVWESLEAEYATLNAGVKSLFKSTTANENGTVLEQAAARYDAIATKYTGINNFANRTVASGLGNGLLTIIDNTVNSTNLMLIIAIASIVVACGICVYVRRKKTNA